MHKQLSFKQHLRQRAFYGGSAVSASHHCWMLDADKKQFNKRWLNYGEALVDNFDEILVNAIDHYYRKIDCNADCGGAMDALRVDFNEQTGFISIWNNGPGIPVISDWPGRTVECYLPEAIMTQERSGSNFNDTEDPDRVTGGMNGLGIKVSNAGSLVFELETVDTVNGFFYRQTCRDRMDIIEPALVISLTDTAALRKHKITKKLQQAHTVIRWLPDYDNLCKDSKTKPAQNWFENNKNTIRSIIQLRTYQTAAFIGSIEYRFNKQDRIEHKPRARVCFNNKLVSIANLNEFVKMFGLKKFFVMEMKTSSDADHPVRFPWYVCLGLVKDLDIEKRKPGFEQMTVCNGIHATLGGSHVNLIKNQLLKGLCDLAGTDDISEAIVDRMFCYFDVKQFPFSSFDFDSQTKNKIKIGREDLNIMKKQFVIPSGVLKKIYKEVKDDVLWKLAAKAEKEQNSASRKARSGPIRKYDKADKAGTRESAQCGLFVPEGDSACKPVRNMIKHKKTPIDKNYYGTYNIQGVPPNARKMIKMYSNPQDPEQYIIVQSKQLRDNISFQGLVRALNLDYKCHYKQTPEGNKQFESLNYGFIVIATDQDLDGIGHICSLILVFIMIFWPDLIRRGFVRRFATPIIRVYIKSESTVKEFYSKKEYDEWVVGEFGSESKKPSTYRTEYYKGLGGHSKEEVLSMGMCFHENIFTFTYDKAAKTIMEAFYGEDTDSRKKILSTAVIDEYPESMWKSQKIAASVHFKVETKEFQLANMRRKLKSCIDGMIPTQRKAFAGGRRMFANPKIGKAKVFQVSGYVAQHMHYANGDSSMNGVIMKQAQGYIGSNNIPAFVAISDGFGDRVLGRSNNAGARYIDTKFNSRIMDLIFPRHFDWLLDYVYEDGVMCEPTYYVPVIPMALLETENTTGTGWKIDVWARDLQFTLENVRRMISGFPALSFKGKVWLRSKDLSCRIVNGRETCYGKYSYNAKTNCITVSELPLRIWSHAYECHLTGVDPKTGKTDRVNEDGELVAIPRKPFITKVKDDTSNYVNEIKIWLEPGAYEKILAQYGNQHSDAIEDFLDLRRYLIPNLNMIDHTNHVREFANYKQVLEYWFPICLRMHEDYLERELILKDILIDYYRNVLRFILADGASPKQINIDKDFTDAERDAILSKHDYTKFNKHVLMNPRFATVEKLHELIYFNNASYDYISDITVREKSQSQVDKLRKKIAELEYDLITLQSTDAQSLWLNEIEKIETTVKHGMATDWMFETEKHVFTRG